MEDAFADRSGYRLGIDVGGTFTDLVLFSEESGALVVDKVPSVPSDPSTTAVTSPPAT